MYGFIIKVSNMYIYTLAMTNTHGVRYALVKSIHEATVFNGYGAHMVSTNWPTESEILPVERTIKIIKEG